MSSSVITVSDKLSCLEKIFGRGTLSGNSKNFDVWCPLCNHKDKSKRKLSIHVETGAYHCWVCEARGSFVGFLTKKYGTKDDVVEVQRVFERQIWSKTTDPEQTQEQKIELPSDFQLLALSSPRNKDALDCLKYLVGRGLTSDDCWFYKFGMSSLWPWQRKIIFPSFDVEGRLNYYQGRAVDDVPKYKRYKTVDADKTKVIFNEINVDWSQRLVLCEGPFDYVKCGQNSTPLLGNTINEDSLLFYKIVMNSTPVALALDSDMKKRTSLLVKKFEEYNIDVVVVDLGSHKDPGEMSKEEFAEALSRAEKPTWRSMFLSKLNDARHVSMRI